MRYQDIFNLFGYSEFSPEFKELLPKLHISLDRPEISICWRRFQSSKWDLSLSCTAKNNYICDFGPVVKEYASDFDECFFEEINFGGTGQGVKYPHHLPYDLNWGNNAALVQQKIPIRKSESGSASYGSYMIFNFEDYSFLTAFDNSNELIWLRVKLLEISFKRKRELTKSLRQQNKNLVIPNISDFKLLKERSPITAWANRMKEGDNKFTIKSIADAENLLHAFLESLLIATEQKKASSIYSATRKLTQGFNKLNDKYQSCIETLEREELVNYIHDAIRLTGFIIEPEIDLTEEWREW
ncbi:MAG: hypothetical protein NTW29_20015 [Bacteroidetes bacterium]|nr:hypothetical protein [Bacteroidota bacterium]